MQRSIAFPLALLVAFFLGGLSPHWTVRAQDEKGDTKPKPAKPERRKPGGDKPPLVWERLNSEGGGGANLRCSRSKIAGGWLVMIERVQRAPRKGKAAQEEKGARARGTVQPTLTFVPDPTHGWDGGSPQ